jgi:hypothetical protein
VRGAQIARGEALRGRSSHLLVTPCAYEHFALIAAYAAPEDVTVEGRAAPGTVTEDCPGVEVR